MSNESFMKLVFGSMSLVVCVGALCMCIACAWHAGSLENEWKDDARKGQDAKEVRRA